MSYIVKITYEHPSEDALLLSECSVPEIIKNAFSSKYIGTAIILRSDDRTYAEIYLDWATKENYKEWVSYYHNEEFVQESQRYTQSLIDLGLESHYYTPPAENYDWKQHSSRRLDKVSYPESIISYNEIFV
jgi:hypothetical protein